MTQSRASKREAVVATEAQSGACGKAAEERAHARCAGASTAVQPAHIARDWCSLRVVSTRAGWP